MTEPMGYKSTMAMNFVGGNTTNFNSSSLRLEFLSHDIKESIELEQDEGLRGTRTRNAERVALGNVKVAGSVTLEPTPIELNALLPFILGSAATAGAFTPSETLPDLYLMIDQVNEVNTLLVRVNKATFTGEPGKKLKLKLDLVGKTLFQAAAGSFPASIPPVDLSARPYMFWDSGSGITIAGTQYAFDKFELAIDHKITPTYMQGQYATDLEPTDRQVTLSIQTRYTSTEAILFAAIRSGMPQSASLAFTNGTSTLGFTFGKLLGTSESVTIPGRQHLRLPLKYQAYGIGTTRELIVNA